MLSTNFALMLRVKGDVSVEKLNDALSRIRVRHPALAAGDVTFPLAVRLDCGEDDWIEVAQEQLGTSFGDRSGPGPFARFVMLQRTGGFDLVAAFHHGICEGMSGVFVLRDLLQALGNPQVELTPIPAPPPTHELIPQDISKRFRIRQKIAFALMMLQTQIMLKKIRRRFSAKQPVDRSQSTPEDGPTRQFVILPAMLSIEQTKALAARCKREEVSVHAALCVAWLRAFVEMGGKPTGRTVSSPVNLRGRLSPPMKDTAGMFLSLVETRVNCTPERDFWEIAREFKQKLSHGSHDEALFFQPLFLPKVFSSIPPDDMEIALPLMFARPVKYDFSITNLGRLPLSEQSGALQLEAFYGPLVNSSPYERTVGVNTLGGKMSLAFNFRKSMMDSAEGKRLMDRAVALLLQASSA